VSVSHEKSKAICKNKPVFFWGGGRLVVGEDLIKTNQRVLYISSTRSRDRRKNAFFTNLIDVYKSFI